MDEHGYVMATIPATTTKPHVPAIGFIAHVDTSPEMQGARREADRAPRLRRARPRAARRSDGGAARSPTTPRSPSRSATTSSPRPGTTLLGADNKAGVAEIVAAAEYLMAHPEIPHGAIRIAFTPDEEIGRGTNLFDVGRFGAAVRLHDGRRQRAASSRCESFSADAMTVTFQGFNTHPGYAKGRMVNAIKLAAEFIARLPARPPVAGDDRRLRGLRASLRRPGRRSNGRRCGCSSATSRPPGSKEKEALLEELARAVVAAHPRAAVEIRIEESYRNMREVLDRHPEVVEYAREAIRRAGLTPVERPIRGGTDGSRLSFMGLPTPNLFAGEHNFHSRLEWVSAQDMEKAVEVIVNLCRVWEEKTWTAGI